MSSRWGMNLGNFTTAPRTSLVTRGFLVFSLLLSALFAVVGQSRADSVPVTGTGFVDAGPFNDSGAGFSLNGPSFSVFNGLPDGPGSATGTCTGGTICDFTYTIQGGGYAQGSFNGQYIGHLGGSLTFAASAPVPILDTSVATEAQFILPVVVTGQIEGSYYPSGSEAFDYAIYAVGTATIDAIWDDEYGGPGVFTLITDSYDFGGVAVTPERSAWIYFLGGLLLTLGIKRKGVAQLLSWS
jgi:hypothetical protein